MTALLRAFFLLTSFALSVSFSLAVPKGLSPALTQRCAPCHGPDLNGVGGVFPSLMTSELVKSGNMDGVIKFITHGSPVDSQSLVKMPAKGGHLDLGDEEIRNIAKQVIELAQNYVEVKPSKVVSIGGYFKHRFGPVVSTAIETAPVVAWPPAEDASDR
ncbi:MAG: c-type cytochrome, partial [Opitutales bacterium]|nr:c-type cytochrome [Opitutales bacterium]